MNKKKFSLNAKENKPVELELKNPEAETHALLVLTEGDFCNYLNFAFTHHGADVVEKHEAQTMQQLDLHHYKNLSLNGNFTNVKGFVAGEIYTGNWEEIVLTEIEISFSDAPFYYSCDFEKVKFAIGTPDQSRMDIEADADSGYHVTSTIIQPDGPALQAKNFFPEISDGAEIIRRIYGRLKGRAKGEGFEARQQSQLSKLNAQFNKTISESFRNKS